MSSEDFFRAVAEGETKKVEDIIGNVSQDRCRMLVQNIDERTKTLPSFVAAQRGHVDVLRVLVEKGQANVEAASKSGNTAFHFACIGGHVGTAKYILKRSPDLLNRQNRNGDTALMLACRADHWPVIQFLLRQKASARLRNIHGISAAHCMCAANAASSMRVRSLSLPTYDRDGKSMLFENILRKSKRGNLLGAENEESLLELSAKERRAKIYNEMIVPVLNAVAFDECEAKAVLAYFSVHMYTDSVEGVRHVLAMRDDPVLCHRTVADLRLACLMHVRTTVFKRLLIADKSAIDARGPLGGQTPLHLAARSSLGASLVGVLLSAGADVRVRTRQGCNALDICRDTLRKLEQEQKLAKFDIRDDGDGNDDVDGDADDTTCPETGASRTGAAKFRGGPDSDLKRADGSKVKLASDTAACIGPKSHRAASSSSPLGDGFFQQKMLKGAIRAMELKWAEFVAKSKKAASELLAAEYAEDANARSKQRKSTTTQSARKRTTGPRSKSNSNSSGTSCSGSRSSSINNSSTRSSSTICSSSSSSSSRSSSINDRAIRCKSSSRSTTQTNESVATNESKGIREVRRLVQIALDASGITCPFDLAARLTEADVGVEYVDDLRLLNEELLEQIGVPKETGRTFLAWISTKPGSLNTRAFATVRTCIAGVAGARTERKGTPLATARRRTRKSKVNPKILHALTSRSRIRHTFGASLPKSHAARQAENPTPKKRSSTPKKEKGDATKMKCTRPVAVTSSTDRPNSAVAMSWAQRIKGSERRGKGTPPSSLTKMSASTKENVTVKAEPTPSPSSSSSSSAPTHSSHHRTSSEMIAVRSDESDGKVDDAGTSPTTSSTTVTTLGTGSDTSIAAVRQFLFDGDPKIAAACLEPLHVCGMSLQSLSLAQLEILERVHTHQLSAIFEQKTRLVRTLEETGRQELRRLREQLRALEEFTKSGARSDPAGEMGPSS
eukprot:g1894.t1